MKSVSLRHPAASDANKYMWTEKNLKLQCVSNTWCQNVSKGLPHWYGHRPYGRRLSCCDCSGGSGEYRIQTHQALNSKCFSIAYADDVSSRICADESFTCLHKTAHITVHVHRVLQKRAFDPISFGVGYLLPDQILLLERSIFGFKARVSCKHMVHSGSFPQRSDRMWIFILIEARDFLLVKLCSIFSREPLGKFKRICQDLSYFVSNTALDLPSPTRSRCNVCEVPGVICWFSRPWLQALKDIKRVKRK